MSYGSYGSGNSPVVSSNEAMREVTVQKMAVLVLWER